MLGTKFLWFLLVPVRLDRPVESFRSNRFATVKRRVLRGQGDLSHPPATQPDAPSIPRADALAPYADRVLQREQRGHSESNSPCSASSPGKRRPSGRSPGAQRRPPTHSTGRAPYAIRPLLLLCTPIGCCSASNADTARATHPAARAPSRQTAAARPSPGAQRRPPHPLRRHARPLRHPRRCSCSVRRSGAAARATRTQQEQLTLQREYRGHSKSNSPCSASTVHRADVIGSDVGVTVPSSPSSNRFD